MKQLPVTQAIVQGLADFLKAKMPSIKEAYYQFPEPTEKLTFPCCTVMAKIPTFQALSPYTIRRDEPEVEHGKARYLRVVGMYDFVLQVDFWSSYKIQSQYLHDEFINAMSLDPRVTGVSLQLRAYFDQWARFDFDRAEFLAGEEQSQRNEWRVTATVLCNVKVVREHFAHLMETIENTLTTPDSIAAPEDESDATIV